MDLDKIAFLPSLYDFSIVFELYFQALLKKKKKLKNGFLKLPIRWNLLPETTVTVKIGTPVVAKILNTDIFPAPLRILQLKKKKRKF